MISSAILKSAGQAMQISAMQHRVASSNAANANTPGFKAQAVDQSPDDFRDFQPLSSSRMAIGPMPTGFLAPDNYLELPLVEKDGPASSSGNTVDLHAEIASLGEAKLSHGVASQAYRKVLELMRGAIGQ